jgi:hypothetical protein
MHVILGKRFYFIGNELLRFLGVFPTWFHEFFNFLESNGRFISRVDSDIRDSNVRDGFVCPNHEYLHCSPFVCPAVTFHLINQYLCSFPCTNSRSQWPRGLRRRSAGARLLRLRVRIPPMAWMFVCCECCVLSGRGLLSPADHSPRGVLPIVVV